MYNPDENETKNRLRDKQFLCSKYDLPLEMEFEEGGVCEICGCGKEAHSVLRSVETSFGLILCKAHAGVVRLCGIESYEYFQRAF